jgi:hypothetical protein
VILQYVWREDVQLNGPEFGRFDSQSTSLLCGRTLAFDRDGNVLAWARKPGTGFEGSGQRKGDDVSERKMGAERLAEFKIIADRVKAGRIGSVPGDAKGLLATKRPPLIPREVDGALRFELSPHFAIHDDAEDDMGERQWQISS